MIPIPVKRALAARYAKAMLDFYKKKAYTIGVPLPVSIYADYQLAASDCPIDDVTLCKLQQLTETCLEPAYIKTTLQCNTDVNLEITEQTASDSYYITFTNDVDISPRAVVVPKTDAVEQHMYYRLQVNSSIAGPTTSHQVVQPFKVAHRFRYPKGPFRIPFIVIKTHNFTQDEFTFTFKSPAPFFSPNPSCPSCVFVNDSHLQLNHPSAVVAIRDLIINQFKYYSIPSTAYDIEVLDLKDAIGVDFHIKNIPAGTYAGGIRSARNLPSGFSEPIAEPEKIVKPISYIPYKSFTLNGGCSPLNVEIQPFNFTLNVSVSTMFRLNMPTTFSDETVTMAYVASSCPTKRFCYKASEDVVRVESYYGATKLFSSTKKEDCFTIPYGLFGTHTVKAINSTHCSKTFTISYNDPNGDSE